MGKVLSAFTNGFPGAVSRAVDDIIHAWHNMGNDPIPFGAPVFMNSAKTGVIPGSASSLFADFVGFAVRIPAKTPDSYTGQGSDTGSYQPSEMVDTLQRGTIIGKVTGGTPKPMGAVYYVLATGELSADAGSEGDTIQLENCSFGNTSDATGCVEIVVRYRNA